MPTRSHRYSASTQATAKIRLRRHCTDEPQLSRSWQTELANHRDVDCVIEPLHQGADWAVAHWHTTLIHADTGESVALDGVMIVQFNAAGECTNLREWWHNAENKEQRT